MYYQQYKYISEIPYYPYISMTSPDPLRTIQYYTYLQENNPGILVPLVMELKKGKKIPFPCTTNSNVPCAPPVPSSVITKFFEIPIGDQLAHSNRSWSIFFFSNLKNGVPFTLRLWFVNHLLHDNEGNVQGISCHDLDGMHLNIFIFKLLNE
ncbi:hypothetical protein COJ45_27815 [Bacillus cereus]|nr:hypothetical protein COJ45_27815 [Bacillus cereus]